MNITEMTLKNFRNYGEQNIKLDKQINIFYGDNAQGKTNIIEAIYLTAMGKSFRNRKEKELIKFEEKQAMIEVKFEKKDRDGEIKIELKDKKNIYINGIKVQKLSELLGNINIVMFSPDDINILKNGPAGRRKFLDMMISQLRPAYLYHYHMYAKTLEQRNNYLRQINKIENKSKEMIEIWDEKLAEHAEKIYEYRNEFIEKIKEKINDFHKTITNEKEEITIKYLSACENKEKYLKTLKHNLEIDCQRGYTSSGIHKDDFLLFINHKQVNIYGSQGQHRTAILSLKLSELEIVYDDIGEYPILLLDDFMSELDQKRIQNFLKNIKETQIILTCTEKKEIELQKEKVFFVKEGKVKEEKN